MRRRRAAAPGRHRPPHPPRASRRVASCSSSTSTEPGGSRMKRTTEPRTKQARTCGSRGRDKRAEPAWARSHVVRGEENEICTGQKWNKQHGITPQPAAPPSAPAAAAPQAMAQSSRLQAAQPSGSLPPAAMRQLGCCRLLPNAASAGRGPAVQREHARRACRAPRAHREHVRVLGLVDHADVVQLDVQVLVHAVQRPRDRQVILQLHRDLGAGQGGAPDGEQRRSGAGAWGRSRQDQAGGLDHERQPAAAGPDATSPAGNAPHPRHPPPCPRAF